MTDFWQRYFGGGGGNAGPGSDIWTGQGLDRLQSGETLTGGAFGIPGGLTGFDTAYPNAGPYYGPMQAGIPYDPQSYDLLPAGQNAVNLGYVPGRNWPPSYYPGQAPVPSPVPNFNPAGPPSPPPPSGTVPIEQLTQPPATLTPPAFPGERVFPNIGLAQTVQTGWTPPPGMPPGQEMNFGASDFPNIPGGGNVSATDIGVPPSSIYPGAGYDFTGGPDIFPQNPSVPITGAGSDFTNPAPNEGMYPTYGGNEWNDVNIGGNNPGLYQPPYDPTGEIANPPPGATMFPDYTDYPPGTQQFYYPADTQGTVTADQLANPPGISGDEFQWPFYVDQFPSGETPMAPDDTSPAYAGGAAGTPPTGYYGTAGPYSANGIFPDQPVFGNAPTVTAGFDPRQGRSNAVPGELLSPSDAARIYNNQQFPGVGTGGVGGFFKDAAGNILDSTGKLIASAADFAGKFGGSIANLVKGIPGALRNAGEDFVNALPKDWGGLGEGPGFFGMPNAPIQGTFGVNEPGVSRPGQGWAGTGITINDVRNSGVNPSYGNFAPGQVGRSSVPAPNSGMAFIGGGSRANVAALGGDMFARKRLQQMASAYFSGRPVPAPQQTRALVGGPPGNAFSQNFLKTHPLSSPSLSPFLPSSGPGSIVNPSAFGTAPTANRSIHFRPPATP
jgi:hypothetical protein